MSMVDAYELRNANSKKPCDFHGDSIAYQHASMEVRLFIENYFINL